MVEPAPQLPDSDEWSSDLEAPYNLYVKMTSPRDAHDPIDIRKLTGEALREWGVDFLISTEVEYDEYENEDVLIVTYELPTPVAMFIERKAGGSRFEFDVGGGITAAAMLDYLPSQTEPDRIAGDLDG